MSRLVQGMYGTEFRSASNLFGLLCGQMRGVSKMGHNAGWYNKDGQKLGWGDLSVQDFERIARELEDGEFFIILSEGDSFWNFVTRVGPIGSMSETETSVDAPGVEYVVENAMYIIAPGTFYYLRRYPDNKDAEVIHGLHFRVIARDKARGLLAGRG